MLPIPKSQEQRRHKQLLCLLFIYKTRHDDIRRIHVRNRRGANVYSFVTGCYNNVKYKNSPYYKGLIIWDSLPIKARSENVMEIRKALLRIYLHYDPQLI